MVMLELKVRRYAAQLLDVRASLSLPLLLRGLRASRLALSGTTLPMGIDRDLELTFFLS